MSAPGVVLVTGATAGFGRAIARDFAGRGWRVVGTGRREERLEALHEELGRAFLPLVLDMCDTEALSRLPGGLPSEFREVDVLVNNAGLALGLEKADGADLRDWDIMIDTNIRGLVHLTRALIPGMVDRDGGHVVNISSVAGSWPYPGGNVYGASKAFVTQLSLNLRADLVDKNIRVTSIEPGLCETEFSIVRFRGDADAAKDPYRGLTPLGADDVAEAVRWVVDRPPHVNVNRIEIMATEQAFGPFAFHRSRD